MNRIKELWFIYRNKIILSVILSLISVVAFVGIYFFNIQKATADSIEYKSNNDDIETSNAILDNSNEISYDSVKVDIKGEVKKPGVYELNSNNRISDVIKLAGGLTPNADTSVTNLSKRVVDEMVIIIYSKKEVQSFSDTKKTDETKLDKCKNNEKLINNSCVSSDTTVSSKSSLININTASIEELMSLSGIGESKAKSIVEYRTSNGKFLKIEDIMNVTGIGESIFEKIKSNITI